MAGITLAQAQSNLDALVAAQANFDGSASVSISTAGGGRREITFASIDQITRAILFWSRTLAGLERRAAGRSRHGVSLADFSGVQ